VGLPELCEAATLHARYRAHAASLSVDLPAFAAALSPTAEGFLHDLVEPNGDLLDIASLYPLGQPWPGTVVDALARLPHDARLEVLVYLAVPVHEYIHHIDVTSTPFGAFLQTYVVSEFLAFQEFAEVFLREPEAVPTGHLASLGQLFLEGKQRLAEPFRSRWQSLDRHLRWAQVWKDFDDLPPATVERSEGAKITVFSQPFQEVTVDGWWPSYTVEGHGDWYITPTTILELRGVAASLIWVLRALREWDRCCETIAQLIRAIYPPQVGYDYRFILDFAASAARRPSFDALLQDAEPGRIAFCLAIASRAAWVALHLPPPPADSKTPHLDLPGRFLGTLQHAQQIETTYAPQFLDEIFQVDASPLVTDHGLPPVRETLTGTGSYLEQAISLFPLIRNETIREYLLRRLGAAAHRLRQRAPNGYVWMPGIPFDGNPIPHLADAAPELLAPEPVPEPFDEWLTLRRRGFFRPMTATSLRQQIERLFRLEFINFPCICGTLLDPGLPPEFAYFQVTCPSCHRVVSIPGALLRDLRQERQITCSFQELLIDCACGRRITAVVYVGYVTSVHAECECGVVHDLSAEQVMASLAHGGIEGRLAPHVPPPIGE
jgi:hypothetical protein